MTLLDELAHPVGHDSCREEFSSDDVDTDVGARDVLLNCIGHHRMSESRSIAATSSSCTIDRVALIDLYITCPWRNVNSRTRSGSLVTSVSGTANPAWLIR